MEEKRLHEKEFNLSTIGLEGFYFIQEIDKSYLISKTDIWYLENLLAFIEIDGKVSITNYEDKVIELTLDQWDIIFSILKGEWE